MSVYTPPTFANFGKSNMFQIYDKDELEHSVRLVTRSVDGVSFEPQVVYTKGGPRGQVKTSFNTRGFLVDAVVHTDAKKASTITAKKKNVLYNLLQVPGVNAGLGVSTSDKDFSNAVTPYGVFAVATADYTRNNFAATASLTTDAASRVAVAASGAVGFEGFSVGGDVKVVNNGNGSFVPKAYNAGAAYTYQNYTGAIVSDAKFEKIKATVLAKKLGKQRNFVLGAQAKVDLQAGKGAAPQRELILAIEQQATPQTTYKLNALVNSRQFVGGVVHRLPNPSMQLEAIAAFSLPDSTYAPWPITKFGVQLSFGDI